MRRTLLLLILMVQGARRLACYKNLEEPSNQHQHSSTNYRTKANRVVEERGGITG